MCLVRFLFLFLVKYFLNKLKTENKCDDKKYNFKQI